MSATTRVPRRLDRRAFLCGLGGVSVGLPFLESNPERSAWAQGEDPVFALFVGTANGIMAADFWPSRLGALTDLGSDPNATGILGDFSDRLLLLHGLRYPANLTIESHAEACPQMLTGAPYSTARLGNLSLATAPSLDVILAPLLNPDGAEPLTLYSGQKQGYIDEALSWTADGNPRSAEGNPFTVYSSLVSASGQVADAGAVAAAVLVRRQSAVDLARDELMRFRGRNNTSREDELRLEQHLSALRGIEAALDSLATSTCTTDLLDVHGITAVGDTFRQDGMIEVVAKLQLQLAAFAFACGSNRVATLQCGDGLDQTHYNVPSNGRGWPFHHISHQAPSDSVSGNDALAASAHAEIDRLRMETFAHGLRQFDAHGLLDKSIVLWTNQLSDGRSASFSDIPYILAGNPYGRLRSGQHIEYSGNYNGELLTTVANALGVDRLVGTAEKGLDELLA